MSGIGITSVVTIGVPVADQERAVGFYTEVLGLEMYRDAPFGPGRWIEVAPRRAAGPAGTVGSAGTVGLVTSVALVPAGVPAGIRLSVGNADQAHAVLLERGVDVDPRVRRMGGGVPPMFAMSDPDGNRLIVVGGVR